MSRNLIKRFGLIVRELRKAKDLSQEELSEEAGLDRTFLSQLETRSKQPSLLTTFRLATALRTSASELLKKVEEKLGK